ncbi:MAG: XdhC family protein [Proteobacteria bacterium]|uniref:XdhC family protein n=1 Tax=Aquabacterium sp. TaxID=1872578 RepID=UPI0035C74F19|nr:XdhC family protein [Pseudomonadota bacterium]
MHSQDRQVLQALLGWAAQGHRAALVTVVRTWGSAPRPPGAWMALRDDGLVQGSVSGGCIEDDLIARMRAGEFTGTPVLQRYGVTQDEAARFGLPCGGTLELLVEPTPDVPSLRRLAERLDEGRLLRRTVEVASGAVTLDDACRGDVLRWDGLSLSTLHGPRWRLLIIGAGQIARCLAPMAQALDHAVSVCDPREEYAQEWGVPGAPLLAGMPDDVVTAFQPDPHTAIVALTHDPKLDDMALLEALKSPAFYVGALGSRVNNAARRERLRQHFDLSAEEVARLHGPAGLYIGSHTPPEIALSILAEITAVKNGVDVTRPRPAQDDEAMPRRSPGCAVG